MNNPYIPSTMAKDRNRAKQWQKGYEDARAGKGLISSNGAWLEGWHAFHEQQKQAKA